MSNPITTTAHAPTPQPDQTVLSFKDVEKLVKSTPRYASFSVAEVNEGGALLVKRDSNGQHFMQLSRADLQELFDETRKPANTITLKRT